MKIPIIPIFLLLLAMLSLQSGAGFAKQLFPLVGVEGTSALRLSLAAGFLLCVFRPWGLLRSISAWKGIAGYGILLASMNFFFYMSLKTLPLGIASAIQFLGPLGVAIFYSRQAKDGVWVGCAAIGIILLSPWMQPSSNASFSLDPLGTFYALLAALGWAGYIVIGKKTGMRYGTECVAIAMIIAALLVLPLGLYQAGSALFDISILPLALLIAALSSAIPFALEMYVLRRLDANTFGMLLCFEPAFATLIGWWLLHDSLSTLQILGICLVMVASIGASFQPAKPSAH